MSRIQKALEALKNSGGEHREGEQGAHPSRAGLEENRPRREVRKRPSGTGGRALDDARSPVKPAEEVVPRSRIKIDRDKLVEFGFFPKETHNKLISDQFRRIKRPILQSAFETDLPVGDNANVIMIASALPGAGKSFCAFNLALSISTERDAGAMLVDADVLKPSISRSLGLQNHNGLIDYLKDPSIELEDILVGTDMQDIIVIPAGHKHAEATELLASRRMQELIAQLSSKFSNRAVICDTPPLLITSEAQVLAERVGQIALVIEARVSSQESALRALSMLDRDKPINAILNKSRSASQTGYTSDDYGYYPYPDRKIAGAENE